jgi:hypothetical protein
LNSSLLSDCDSVDADAVHPKNSFSSKENSPSRSSSNSPSKSIKIKIHAREHFQK